jgi:hypothetical protein
MIRGRHYMSLAVCVAAFVAYPAIPQTVHKFHGGGGPMVMYLVVDLPEIDREIADLGIPKLGSGMLLYGGAGFGEISSRLKIGGAGFGGSMTTSGYNAPYSRDVSLSLGFGGILGEYDLLYLNRFNVFAGTLLGWGSMSIKINRAESPADWNGIWEDYAQGASVANASTDLDASFFTVMPWVGGRYFLTSWIAADGRIGYFWSSIGGESWRTNGEKVYNSPDIDLGNTYFLFSILFGG